MKMLELNAGNGKMAYSMPIWFCDSCGWPAGPDKPGKPCPLCGSTEFVQRENTVEVKPCA